MIKNRKQQEAKQIWTASGKVQTWDGWTRIYGDTEDDILPQLDTNNIYNSQQITASQKFTNPPARYTEATLVKALENKGIGRPSTYTSTITTIQDRGYVISRDKKLEPTHIAFGVTDFLEKYFGKLMDYQFTADMETKLDEIAEGNIDWQNMLRDFREEFVQDIDHSKSADRVSLEIGKDCPKCEEGKLILRFGKNKNQFVGCSKYPDCDYVTDIAQHDDKILAIKEKYEGLDCPAGGKIVVKTGRFGPFLSSDMYPEVKRIKSISQRENDKITAQLGTIHCDKCEKGIMIVKSTRKGKFLACDQYPDCKNIQNLPKNK